MQLKAEERKTSEKKAGALRREGIIPAILYGGDGKPQPLSIDQTEFERIYQEAGESTIIDLSLGEKKVPVLITDVQRDPFDKFLHVDLQRIKEGEKLTATVAIETEGEAPAVKSGQGLLLTLLDEVEVECFPRDLPAEITVDISGLTEVGQAIEIKDLPVDQSKVKILGHEPDEAVLKIDYAEMSEEEAAEEPATEEEAIASVEASEEKPEEEKEEEESPESSEEE